MKAIISFTRDHPNWAILVVFVLAFCESFSLVSLMVPATTLLLGIGILIGAAGLSFWKIWLSTVLGAIAGAHLAYDLGLLYKRHILDVWPLRKYPEMMATSCRLFLQYGAIAVFLSRFSAPARATAPTIAGVFQLSFIKFTIANVGSALIWATGILSPSWLWSMWWGR